MPKKKKLEPICNNCLLFNRSKQECKVSILIEGAEYHMPVSPGDKCHMDELGIPVQQVRWYVEDPQTGEPADKGTVKIEYPEGFFGSNPD